MSADLERAIVLTDQFEAVDSIAKFYAQDPSTINYIEVESLPLVIGEEKRGAPALIVSCSQTAEYAAGAANYRMHAAVAKFGLVRGEFVDNIRRAGVSWQNVRHPEAMASFKSLNELDEDVTTNRIAILDREEDLSGRLKRIKTRAAIDPTAEYNFPGMLRIMRMFDQLQTSKEIFSEIERTEAQSGADFVAVRNFINHCGIGRFAVSNVIPLPPATIDRKGYSGSKVERRTGDGRITEFSAVFELIEMEQERRCNVDGSIEQSVIGITSQCIDGNTGDDTAIHHQEETADGQRIMRIDNSQALTEYLEDLELGTRSKPISAAEDVNKPLTRRHIGRVLGGFDLSPLSTESVSAAF